MENLTFKRFVWYNWYVLDLLTMGNISVITHLSLVKEKFAWNFLIPALNLSAMKLAIIILFQFIHINILLTETSLSLLYFSE